MDEASLPDWERLLAAERHLQLLVPGSVLVGGTATALHALAEMARIKAWLLATRATTRDYLDVVVLFERLGQEGVRLALQSLDDLYPQPGGASVLAEVVERLGAAQPVDAAEVDLTTYRGLRSPWNDWGFVVDNGRSWAQALARLLLDGKGEER